MIFIWIELCLTRCKQYRPTNTHETAQRHPLYIGLLVMRRAREPFNECMIDDGIRNRTKADATGCCRRRAAGSLASSPLSLPSSTIVLPIRAVFNSSPV